MKVRTNVKAGGMAINRSESLKVHTGVKVGGITVNRSSPLTVGAEGARRLSGAEEGEGAARRPMRGRSSSPARSIGIEESQFGSRNWKSRTGSHALAAPGKTRDRPKFFAQTGSP